MSLRELQHLENLTEDGNFRRKIAAIIRDAKGHGYDITIYSSLRTVAEQKEKVRLGYSKTMKSKHLPGWDGLSRAVDLADSKTAWGCHRTTWLMIGRLALTKGLKWGGLWGLPLKTRKRLVAFLIAEHTEENPFRPLDWVNEDGKPGPLGWDAAHVEL